MTLFRLRRDLPAIRDVSHNQLQRGINELFDGFLADWPSNRWDGNANVSKDFVPTLDIKENKDSFEVHAELPGVKKEDIELQLKDNTLYLKGEKKSEQSEEKDGWYRSERSFGSFSRVIPFSAEVDEERVEARYDNGVLKVRVLKSTDDIRKTRKISIS